MPTTELTKSEKWDFLKSRGWYQYYNDEYWCNEKMKNHNNFKGLQGFSPEDCGKSTDEAYNYEVKECQQPTN